MSEGVSVSTAGEVITVTLPRRQLDSEQLDPLAPPVHLLAHRRGGGAYSHASERSTLATRQPVFDVV